MSSQVSSDEPSGSGSGVRTDTAGLEESHRNFAQLLARLDHSTEEIRLLRHLVELRIRAIELAQSRAAPEPSVPDGGSSAFSKAVRYESMIKSDAFGQCNICFEEEPYDPVGCIYCLQFIGCRKCVNRWYEAACRLGGKQCPLCRHEWEDQPEVMDIFELKIN